MLLILSGHSGDAGCCSEKNYESQNALFPSFSPRESKGEFNQSCHEEPVLSANQKANVRLEAGGGKCTRFEIGKLAGLWELRLELGCWLEWALIWCGEGGGTQACLRSIVLHNGRG